MGRTDLDDAISVIVPCAGSASRFSAAYPKELHCMQPGVALIDLALKPLLTLARSGRKIRLIVVISKNRGATIDHLYRYADLLDIVFTFQSSYDSGLIDAIEAASDLCIGVTLLVLPDLHLLGRSIDNRFENLLTLLTKFHCAAIAARESDPQTICQGGALEIADQADMSVIIRAEEKPAAKGSFGAIWGIIGVMAGKHKTLLSIYSRGSDNLLLGAPVLFVEGLSNYNFPPHLSLPPAE